ncbi:MAG: hypothetical protein ND895_15155 [Pyrinomonadaceae bacterium]|nr:hypothetical protein [Pyrinomonadaceae bacterium]
MNTVAELTIRALAESGVERLDGYSSSLSEACEATPPPYGMAWYGEKYREIACDPSWLANSLIANAAKEGEGSQKLWALAGRATQPEVSKQVRLHAIDEARHARLYISMLGIAFPEAVDKEIIAELNKLSPGYTSDDEPDRLPAAAEAQVLDELIQMNIGEIRTRIHQLLLRPVIMVHCPPESRSKLQRILDSLLGDETRHIEYTARLIEKAMAEESAFVRHTMRKRLDEFNQITLDEVGELSFEGA